MFSEFLKKKKKKREYKYGPDSKSAMLRAGRAHCNRTTTVSQCPCLSSMSFLNTRLASLSLWLVLVTRSEVDRTFKYKTNVKTVILPFYKSFAFVKAWLCVYFVVRSRLSE